MNFENKPYMNQPNMASYHTFIPEYFNPLTSKTSQKEVNSEMVLSSKNKYLRCRMIILTNYEFSFQTPALPINELVRQMSENECDQQS